MECYNPTALIQEQIKKVEKEQKKVDKQIRDLGPTLKRDLNGLKKQQKDLEAAYQQKTTTLKKQQRDLKESHRQLQNIQQTLTAPALASKLTTKVKQPPQKRSTTRPSRISVDDLLNNENESRTVSRININSDITALTTFQNQFVNIGSRSGYRRTSFNGSDPKRVRIATTTEAQQVVVAPMTPPAMPFIGHLELTAVHVPACSVIVETVQRSWVELRCHNCAQNINGLTGKYLEGWKGVEAHISALHGNRDKKQAETWPQYILRTCFVRIVPVPEVIEINLGNVIIPKVGPGGIILNAPITKNAAVASTSGNTQFIDQSADTSAAITPVRPDPRATYARQVPPWVHYDGTGLHNQCSICDGHAMTGQLVRVCHVCGWGCCTDCHILRGHHLEHYNCSNDKGLIDLFEQRQY